MSYFCGFHNLVMFITVFFMIFSTATSMATEEDPLFELSNQEDFVQMAGYGEEKLSTVLVTGSVHCEACLHGHEAELHAWPISGALVTVNCHNNGKNSRSRWAEAVTDEFGEFIVDLPSHLHAVPNLEQTCSVKVLRIPKNSPCRPAYVKKQKGLKLSSFGNGIRTYSAGKIRFMDLTSGPLQACMKKSGDREMQR
uniref:Pollen Ole e 1 allergen and extensin family protein n=1 Tax=Fagus sylvatica TaxID=28930 RepID=A0A2N9GHJ5_FAGSY